MKRILLCLGVSLSLLPSAWAGGGASYTYYAELVTKASGTGMGKVYSSTALQASQSLSYATTSTATANKEVKNASSAAITFYAYAQPSDGYEWSHWSKEENGSSLSTNNPYTVTVTAKSTTEDDPTSETLYAVFAKPRQPIEKPTAATGLVYDGTLQTGVAAGAHYTLGGTYQAKNAGSYTATVTPASGYCWTDKSRGTIELAWTIARRPVTVSVLPTGKTVGEEEPVYETQAEGFVDGDATETEVSWKVWRTDLVEQGDGSLAPNEAVGTYDLVVSGTEQTANYAIAYVNGPGAFEIRPAVIKIAVPTAAPGLVYDGKAKTGVAGGVGYVLSGTVTATDAGVYSATATLLEGYRWADGSVDAKTVEWSIAKANYDMSYVMFQHKASVYNGQVQPLAVTGPLPDGVTVAYENNANKDVGFYTVTAKFTGDTKNHNPIGDLTADLAIEPAVATVTADAKAKTFGAADPTLTATVSGLFGEDSVVYALSRAAGESVGTYVITPTGDADQGNYYVMFVPGTLTVGKAKVAEDGSEPGAGTVPEGGLSKFDATATYDGLGHTIDTNALVDAVSLPRQKDGSLRIQYAIDASGAGGARALPANAPDGSVWVDVAPSFTNVGEYVVWYRVTADNYETFAHAAQLTISPLAITVTPDAGQEKTVGEAYAISFTTNVAMVGSDRFTGALAAETEAVGTQRIVLDTLAIDDGNGGENYMLTFDETVTIVVKSPPPSISDDEGQIDYDPATKEVVVTPDAGVKEVEIVNMPSDATAQVPTSVDTVKGVTPEQVVVVAEATNETGTVKVDITDAFKIAETSAGVTIELNEDPAAEAVIEIGGEKEMIKVTPELTETGDTTVEPLEVATENVELGVKTIPGLTYHLKRSTTLGGAAETVVSKTAKGTRTKLTDPMTGEKPRQAFYVIEVTK